MILGLDYNTWIALSGAVFSGIMAILAARSRVEAAASAAEALRHAKRSDARDVLWPVFNEVREILLELHSDGVGVVDGLWARANNIYQTNSPTTPADVLEFINDLMKLLALRSEIQGVPPVDRVKSSLNWKNLMYMHDRSKQIFRAYIGMD